MVGISEEPGLREYLAVLSRRKRAMLAFVAIVLLVAVGSNMVQAPRYEAQAQILIEPRASDQELNQSNPTLLVDRKRIVDTEVRLLSSTQVRDAVESKFGPDTPDATTIAIEGTDLLSISVISTDPALAAAVANETARQYIDFRTESTKADLANAAVSVQKQLDAARSRLDELDLAIALSEGAAQAVNQADRSVAAEEVRSIASRLDALELRQQLTQGNATLVDVAQIPSSALGPQPIGTGLLAIFAGGVVAVGLAFALEFFDDRIDARAGLDAVLPRVPVLGQIPVLDGWGGNREATHVAAIESADGAVAEAYRRLRTALQFIATGDDCIAIQVTSAMPGEGKTTTATNLAVMFALAGQRTVLVDADLRRPRVHSFLGLDNEIGLTTGLHKKLTAREVGHRVLDGPPLWAVTAGPPSPQPAELLQSDEVSRFLDECRSSADVIIVDSPPVVPVADAVALSAHVDAVLLVVSVARSTKRNVKQAVDTLGQVGANVCGIALAEVPASQLGNDQTYAYQPTSDRRGIERFFRPEPSR
jgi:non-specific protein-tyrosine kinase